MSIFQLFELFFYSLERLFFVLEYPKPHFRGLYCLKYKWWENGHFLDQNHGLLLLEKSQFSIFWSSCFYSLERRFYVLKYPKLHFPGQYCLKKKKWKYGQFLTKTWVNPFGKILIFWVLNLLFLKPRKAFFRSGIS